ncbi:MAG TPA: RidA family protein, partial [Terriglobales bacterium]|nr:RidA family protein [Terriglobales bacterium]
MRRRYQKFLPQLVCAVVVLSAAVAAQQIGAVSHVQTSAHTNRFHSPAVDAGDYLYISGQGPQRADGSLTASFGEQARQALDNIKAIVEAAGLTLDNVVYTQVYLEDINKYDEMNRIFGEYFVKTPPARALLGVARVPEPPIEINAVAVRNLAERRAVYPPNYKPGESA